MKRDQSTPGRNRKTLPARRFCVLWVFLLVTLITGTAGCQDAAQIQPETKPAESSGSIQNITQTPVPPTVPPAPPLATHTPLPAPSATATPAWPQIPDLGSEDLPVGSRTYILPLTIRHTTQDAVTLSFALDEPSPGYLFYQQISPLQSGIQGIPLPPDETYHQITLDGLPAGAEFLAIVGLEDQTGNFQQPGFLDPPWNSVRFRTASTQQPLRVGVFGDASFGDAATETLMNLMATYDLDFAIDNGDVVAEIYDNNGPVEAYALKFFKTLSPLLHTMPVYTVIGNHDYDAAASWGDSFFYFYAFQPLQADGFSSPKDLLQYYAFSYFGVQFLMLDSQVFFGKSGWDEQNVWMFERLSDPGYRFTIPVFHVPPFYSSLVHPDDQIPVRQNWHPTFTNAGVPLALSGHSHQYERLLADGVQYIVSGGGSSILYAASEFLPQSQVFARRTHFVLLEIYPDHISVTAIAKDGELIDQTEIAVPQE